MPWRCGGQRKSKAESRERSQPKTKQNKTKRIQNPHAIQHSPEI